MMADGALHEIPQLLCGTPHSIPLVQVRREYSSRSFVRQRFDFCSICSVTAVGFTVNDALLIYKSESSACLIAFICFYDAGDASS
jgi:hypothetical protein